MGKVVKAVASVAAVASLFVPGLNIVTATLASGSILGAAAAVGGALLLNGALRKTPKSGAELSKLSPQLDPGAFRKIAFGRTAFSLDIRYYEPSGTNQEYFDYIIVHAAHAVESIEEIWFEDRLAWSSASGVSAAYSGYLTVTTRLEGNSGNFIAINGGGKWGAAHYLPGCAYTHLRFKRTGNSKKAESPLVNGLPGRVTIIGTGAKLYDPRLDSTVSGGSGSHRANNQATWGTSTGRSNPALQILFYLLGWQADGGLSVGMGLPAARLDLPSFIAAANACDDSIALSGGGTQKRYEANFLASEGDDPLTVLQTALDACNGTLRDVDGRIGLSVIVNDLATPAADLNDNDVLGAFTWRQSPGIGTIANVVRGSYTNPSNNSLYQQVEYPVVALTSPDGIERAVTLDLIAVTDPARAQRIAKQYLQRLQYQGTFEADFSIKALAAKVGQVVRLSFEPLGWSLKLFRVMAQTVSPSGRIAMTLREENAAIYAWAAEETAAVTPAAPTVYDPLNSPFILAAGEAADDASSALADAAAAGETSAVNLYRIETLDHTTVDATGGAALGPAGYQDVLLSETGLAPGDVIAVSAEMSAPAVSGATVELRVQCRADGGTVLLEAGAGPSAISEFRRQEIANVTIPASTHWVRLIANRVGSGTWQARRYMMNRGPIAAPYALPTRGATRNTVTYSATAPTSPVDGDLWVDTSGAFAVFKLRSGGAWQTGANALTAYNALSGKPVALADINTTESTKLTGIEANATVGAAWGDNLTGRPTELTDGRVPAVIASGGAIVAGKVSNSASGDASSTFNHTGWTTIGTATLTPASASSRILVFVSGIMIVGDGSAVGTEGWLRVDRNGTIVVAQRTLSTSRGFEVPFSFGFVETGLTGSQTWNVQYRAQNTHGAGDPHAVNNSSVTPIDLKA